MSATSAAATTTAAAAAASQKRRPSFLQLSTQSRSGTNSGNVSPSGSSMRNLSPKMEEILTSKTTSKSPESLEIDGWFTASQLLGVPKDKRNKYVTAELASHIAEWLPFSALNESLILEVAKVVEHVALPAGYFIATMGEVGETMYTVLSGVVEYNRNGETGTLSGCSFGAEALYRQPYMATYRCMDTTQILLLHTSDWVRIFEEKKQLMNTNCDLMVLTALSHPEERRLTPQITSISKVLSKLGTFSLLSPSALQAVSAHATITVYNNHHLICKKGDGSLTFNVLLIGTIEALTLQQTVLHSYNEGDSFGDAFGGIGVDVWALRAAGRVSLISISNAVFATYVEPCLKSVLSSKYDFLRKSFPETEMLSSVSLQSIASFFRSATFPENTTIVTQGDNIGRIYFIVKGHLQLSLTAEFGAANGVVERHVQSLPSAFQPSNLDFGGEGVEDPQRRIVEGTMRRHCVHMTLPVATAVEGDALGSTFVFAGCRKWPITVFSKTAVETLYVPVSTFHEKNFPIMYTVLKKHAYYQWQQYLRLVSAAIDIKKQFGWRINDEHRVFSLFGQLHGDASREPFVDPKYSALNVDATTQIPPPPPARPYSVSYRHHQRKLLRERLAIRPMTAEEKDKERRDTWMRACKEAHIGWASKLPKNDVVVSELVFEGKEPPITDPQFSSLPKYVSMGIGKEVHQAVAGRMKTVSSSQNIVPSPPKKSKSMLFSKSPSKQPSSASKNTNTAKKLPQSTVMSIDIPISRSQLLDDIDENDVTPTATEETKNKTPVITKILSPGTVFQSPRNAFRKATLVQQLSFTKKGDNNNINHNASRYVSQKHRKGSSDFGSIWDNVDLFQMRSPKSASSLQTPKSPLSESSPKTPSSSSSKPRHLYDFHPVVYDDPAATTALSPVAPASPQSGKPASRWSTVRINRANLKHITTPKHGKISPTSPKNLKSLENALLGIVDGGGDDDDDDDVDNDSGESNDDNIDDIGDDVSESKTSENRPNTRAHGDNVPLVHHEAVKHTISANSVVRRRSFFRGEKWRGKLSFGTFALPVDLTTRKAPRKLDPQETRSKPLTLGQLFKQFQMQQTVRRELGLTAEHAKPTNRPRTTR